jgi:photosystem II stability/assembly factor-like uncharacterized protein
LPTVPHRLCTVFVAGALLAGLATAQSVPLARAPTPVDLTEVSWRLIGPFRGGWSEMVEGIPGHPDSYVFGAAGGGVWRTDNGGRTWRSLFDTGPSAPVGAIAVAPSDPQTIYIGTGQPEPRYDVAAGAGVYRSRDGGLTWQALGLQDTRHIGRIWVHPRDPQTVLVAALGHIFGPNAQRGVFRSVDGGANWTQVLQIDADTGAVDIASDPADPQVLIAASWQARQFPWQSYYTPIAGPGSALYRSVDDGVSWHKLGGAGWPQGPLGRISIATARTPAGLRVYAVVAAEKESGLYRSDDGGARWERVNPEPGLSNYYASRISVAHDDPDTVYTVGQSIRRCTAGGRDCTIIKGSPGGDDYHQVWIDPEHPDHIAAASDQGTVISTDRGRTWSSWLNQPTGQFYHLATDERFPYWIYAAQQDSGTVAIASRSDYGAIGPRDANPVGADERDDVIPDPDDLNIVYGSGLGGRVTRFDRRTGQVANITPYPVPNYGKRQTTTAHHFPWVTPLAISRKGPKTLYLGGEVLFASRDEGRHWVIASPDLTGKVAGAARCDGDVVLANTRACGYGSIWTIAPSPRHAGEIWVGTDDGLIQRTGDGGAHWADRTPAGLAPWTKVATIEPSPLEDGVAYAALDGQRRDDFRPAVLKTRDDGRSWQDATGDLPAEHIVHVLRADPLRRGLLYAGTETGVFVSADDGAHWLPLGAGLPTAGVRDLLVHGNDLIAATQGRAIWILDDLTPLRALAAGVATPERPFLVTPAAAWRVRFNNNHDTPMPEEEPVGRNPPEGALLDYWLPRPAQRVEIEIRDAQGALVQRLSSEPGDEPAADRYFSATWVQGAPTLAHDAGMHRTSWNLRYARPRAIQYEYSIAAVPGRPTPLLPEGPYATPGRYRVTLRVDGATSEQELLLRPDPRVSVETANLRRSLRLSQSIALALARARQGYGEAQAAAQQLAGTGAALAGAPARDGLRKQVSDLLDTLKAPPGTPSFEYLSRVLTAIESDLETTDLSPTDAQEQVVASTRAAIDARWKQWLRWREQDLATVNAALAAAGVVPVRIPPADALVVTPPEGGEDLP